jgi:hypothetical protein
MCFVSTPSMSSPTLPAETSAMKQPDGGAVRSTVGRRTMDRMRAGTDTILTSGSGVTTAAPTEKKTLLGQ